MKRIVLTLILVLSIGSLAFAQLKKNAYQIQTWSSATTGASTTITFPYESRDLIIQNDDTDAVWVDITGTATTCAQNVAGCMLLKGGNELTMYDYGVNSIKIFTFLAQASPISVTVAY